MRATTALTIVQNSKSILVGSLEQSIHRNSLQYDGMYELYPLKAKRIIELIVKVFCLADLYHEFAGVFKNTGTIINGIGEYQLLKNANGLKAFLRNHYEGLLSSTENIIKELEKYAETVYFAQIKDGLTDLPWLGNREAATKIFKSIQTRLEETRADINSIIVNLQRTVDKTDLLKIYQGYSKKIEQLSQKLKDYSLLRKDNVQPAITVAIPLADNTTSLKSGDTMQPLFTQSSSTIKAIQDVTLDLPQPSAIQATPLRVSPSEQMVKQEIKPILDNKSARLNDSDTHQYIAYRHEFIQNWLLFKLSDEFITNPSSFQPTESSDYFSNIIESIALKFGITEPTKKQIMLDLVSKTPAEREKIRKDAFAKCLASALSYCFAENNAELKCLFQGWLEYNYSLIKEKLIKLKFEIKTDAVYQQFLKYEELQQSQRQHMRMIINELSNNYKKLTESANPKRSKLLLENAYNHFLAIYDKILRERLFTIYSEFKSPLQKLYLDFAAINKERGNIINELDAFDSLIAHCHVLLADYDEQKDASNTIIENITEKREQHLELTAISQARKSLNELLNQIKAKNYTLRNILTGFIRNIKQVPGNIAFIVKNPRKVGNILKSFFIDVGKNIISDIRKHPIRSAAILMGMAAIGIIGVAAGAATGGVALYAALGTEIAIAAGVMGGAAITVAGGAALSAANATVNALHMAISTEREFALQKEKDEEHQQTLQQALVQELGEREPLLSGSREEQYETQLFTETIDSAYNELQRNEHDLILKNNALGRKLEADWHFIEVFDKRIELTAKSMASKKKAGDARATLEKVEDTLFKKRMRTALKLKVNGIEQDYTPLRFVASDTELLALLDIKQLDFIKFLEAQDTKTFFEKLRKVFDSNNEKKMLQTICKNKGCNEGYELVKGSVKNKKDKNLACINYIALLKKINYVDSITLSYYLESKGNKLYCLEWDEDENQYSYEDNYEDSLNPIFISYQIEESQNKSSIVYTVFKPIQTSAVSAFAQSTLPNLSEELADTVLTWQTWYSCDDINLILNLSIQYKLGNFASGCNYLLTQQFNQNWIAVTPAVDTLVEQNQRSFRDTQVSSISIAYFFDKNLHGQTEIERIATELLQILQQDSVAAVYAKMSEIQATGNRLEIITDTLKGSQSHNFIHQTLQRLLVEQRNLKRDIFDELMPKLKVRDGQAKILFPYNRSNIHWLVGEVIINKERNNFTITLLAHDPYGGGDLEEGNKVILRTAIEKRIKDSIPQAGFKWELNQVSPYERRQAVNDGVSCGVIVVEDILRRIRGESLAVTYPIYAVEARREHVALAQQYLLESNPDRQRLEQMLGLLIAHKESSTSISNQLTADGIFNGKVKNDNVAIGRNRYSSFSQVNYDIAQTEEVLIDQVKKASISTPVVFKEYQENLQKQYQRL